MRLVRDRRVPPQAFFFVVRGAQLHMYICYLDESGTDIVGSGTSHFVYLGLAIAAETWKAKDREVSQILTKYELAGQEVHAAWLARRYPDQEKIQGFDSMSRPDRRKAVTTERNAWLVRTAALKSKEHLENLKKNLRKTAHYTHLALAERWTLLRELGDVIGSWSDARLFAEACDKTCYGTVPPSKPLYEEAFTQITNRYQAFLSHKGRYEKREIFGLMVHDNNETVSRKLTETMRRFHEAGTFWWKIDRIVETPLFVDSTLTAMVQLADLCAYATRRFFENREVDLFNRIYGRFDRTGTRVVGIRHYCHQTTCQCRVCKEHK
jgi:Protein of unknown function (DUF3800)